MADDDWGGQGHGRGRAPALGSRRASGGGSWWRVPRRQWHEVAERWRPRCRCGGWGRWRTGPGGAPHGRAPCWWCSSRPSSSARGRSSSRPRIGGRCSTQGGGSRAVVLTGRRRMSSMSGHGVDLKNCGCMGQQGQAREGTKCPNFRRPPPGRWKLM
jgi:hypothetical protein